MVLGAKIQDQCARELGFHFEAFLSFIVFLCSHDLPMCGQKEGEQALLYLLYLYKH